MFSKTTEYALRAVIYIAKKRESAMKLSIGEIAKAIDSPVSFTAKIMQKLTAGNRIISSVRGPKGGFYISAKAASLPVKEVLVAMGEDEIFTDCILGLNQCSEINPCPLHFEYKKIRTQIIALFESKTIDDLAKDLQSGDSVIKIGSSLRKKK